MSSIDETLFIALNRLRNILFRDLELIFREHKLTSTQFAILEVLYNKGDLSVGDIQKYILGTNGNVPLVIKNLERDGLIKRTKDEKDARISIISLSDLGREKVEKVYPLQKERLKILLDSISEEEKKSVTKNIIKMYKFADEL